jgi:hypothetical protein
MIWFEKSRIPPGEWKFLNTVRAGLVEFERALESEIDLTEGNEAITITGCMRAYRHAVMRRVLDLTQSVVVSWNCGSLTGAVVGARSLLETIATFHAFLIRAQAAAAANNWERIGRLVDAYAFSTSSGPSRKTTKTNDDPPTIGTIVKDFIGATEAGAEEFWNQICDTAHPNGRRMLSYAGVLKDRHYIAKSATENEQTLFQAVYNTLHSCCWLIDADHECEILLEVIRNGGDLDPDHELIVKRNLVDKVSEELVKAPVMESAATSNPSESNKKLRILCLGWGSLVWDLDGLPVRQDWEADGPLVPVEFLRKSGKHGYVSLVLNQSADPVTSYWTVMDADDIAKAITALRVREDIPLDYERKNIHVWSKGDPSPSLISGLADWAKTKYADHVIWTALTWKFDKLPRAPTVEQVISYLRDLKGERRTVAEYYVRRAPLQTRTKYRTAIENALGWTPLEE